MPRGRPFQSGNNLGRGRPKGSRNRKSLLAEELLDSHAEAVVSQTLALPRKGMVKCSGSFPAISFHDAESCRSKRGPCRWAPPRNCRRHRKS
jgi:hypothetical protein